MGNQYDRQQLAAIANAVLVAAGSGFQHYESYTKDKIIDALSNAIGTHHKARVDALETLLPPHKCSLHLTHNQHKSYYETVQDYTESDPENPLGEWVSEYQKAKAYETQELWQLQIYPDTPIGFYCYWGADLSAVLIAANPALPSDKGA